MGLLEKWFPQDDATSSLDTATQIIEWTRPIYFKAFMAYLDRGCDERIGRGSREDMIAQQSRIDAFKDIRDHVRKEIAEAQAILQEAQGE